MINDDETQASQPLSQPPPEQPSSSQSQPSQSQSQSRKKNHNEYDWIFAFEVDEDECFYKLSREKYKMTCTHNGLKWVCTAHLNSDDHDMTVSYYSCSSKHCIQNKEDTCPFRYCVKKCLKDGHHYVYRLNEEHSNKYVDQPTDYFTSQWLVGKFNNLQIFHTPPGFESTDNPCESFNGLLNKFTNRPQISVRFLYQVLLDHVIPFYCLNHREFFFYRVPDKIINDYAALIKPESFRVVSDTIVGPNKIHRIDFTVNSCTCRWYLSYAICSHVVAACKYYNRQLNGKKAHRNYCYRGKRGPKPAVNPMIQYLKSVAKTIVDTIPELTSKQQQPEPEEEIVEDEENQENIEPAPKKGRGRPPLSEKVKQERKAEKQRKLEERKQQPKKKTGGRTPLAS